MKCVILEINKFVEVHTMKKKNIILGIIVLVVVVLSVCFFTRPKALGNMTNSFDEPTTSSSNISFSCEANDKIKFSFKSNVEAGELDIILYDSNGEVVYELDRAKALETFYTLNKADTYILKAEYSDFVGSYKIVVYEAE